MNSSRKADDLSSVGKIFHKAGAAALNAQFPMAVLVNGTDNWHYFLISRFPQLVTLIRKDGPHEHVSLQEDGYGINKPRIIFRRNIGFELKTSGLCAHATISII